ncbi:MBL fold metallo-hydrolase [Longirhabdus pacifica]|uniref:MBL fold metallo-hydrolase n=1 Tax=Longirhabdus pacifica TaxID=2305227 RepID=UPI00100929D0|nr:MBL fold metallo-hydrolase [Longirhabdus pacifica]
MRCKATVLSENTVFGNLGAIAEHGWAVYLETDYGNYLFDTGQGYALINNATIFKKSLTDLKGIILSHHHIDHTGGLLDAVKMVESKQVNVYAHPHLFKESYLVRNDYKHIGVPHAKSVLESNGANFVWNTTFTEIAPHIFLTGEVPRITNFEHGDQDMVEKINQNYVQDDFIDDQSIVIQTTKGLFVILGCSHAGIINILHHAIKQTGDDRIHTVIGGTHLWPVSDEQKKKSIAALKELNVQHLGVSHCTGFEVSTQLAEQFGDAFFLCNVGTSVAY